MKKSNWLFILVLLFVFPGFAGAQEKITPEFLWKVGRVSEPQLSTDGKEVLYTVKRYNLQTNKGNSDIYKVNLATGTSSLLAKDSANETTGKWRKDGKKYST